MGSERDRAIARSAWDTGWGMRCKPNDVEIAAIIADVDAQHPAPALPRDVAKAYEDGRAQGWRDARSQAFSGLPSDIPRDVSLLRIADEVRVCAATRVFDRVSRNSGEWPGNNCDHCEGEGSVVEGEPCAICGGVGWVPETPGALADIDLADIVSRHLPTDEEREAERAVVEAVVAEHAAHRADESVRRCAEASLRTSDAVENLLAIRAKRGAR